MDEVEGSSHDRYSSWSSLRVLAWVMVVVESLLPAVIARVGILTETQLGLLDSL